jgi:hypothetical protein
MLDLTGILTDGRENVYSVFMSDSTPTTGQYFGMLATIHIPLFPIIAEFSHLTITVPEPSTLLFLLIPLRSLRRRRS